MRQECRYYEECNAPLCPLMSEEELKQALWYPDEEICRRRDFSHILFIRNQRKIAKRAKDNEHYFTYEMLNRDMRISRGIQGIDPNKDAKPQIRKWLKAHREITQEERERMRARGRQLYDQGLGAKSN